MTNPYYDLVVLGAGAAGLFCAGLQGQRGQTVLVLDHAKKPAEKVRISGGGRCNFTNIHSTARNFLSSNPKFCISALKRYRPRDFIALVEDYGIAYHEKTLGQQFCDDSAQNIIDMLITECNKGDVEIRLQTQITEVRKTDPGFIVETSGGAVSCTKLVVATGGKSIPKMGATGFGYDLAQQFGHSIVETRAGLVPLTFQGELLEFCKSLAGVSLDAIVSFGKTKFQEGMLFTHRGISGPSILQISSYWQEGQAVSINLMPDEKLPQEWLREQKREAPKQELKTRLSHRLPSRLAESLIEQEGLAGRLADLSDKKLNKLAELIKAWQVLPAGSEGYRTAEVTLGGVETSEISSQNMESLKVPGLYFIGEVVDVTGHLGGHNFQWAWASAAVVD